MKVKIRNCSICLRDLQTHLMVYDWGEWTCTTGTNEQNSNKKICDKIDASGEWI